MGLQTLGLAYINPDKIIPNPENPRKKMGFDDKRMNELISSINDLGILVPLIAYFDKENQNYVLLDGERRWRCAKKLNLPNVPVNLIEKLSRLQNILEMFNIHNVRIEWGAMETAWKLERIMEESGKTKDSELSKLTSLKLNEIRKLKTLLSYDKKYQNLVFEGPKDGGLKEDFLVELKPIVKFINDKTKIKINSFLDSVIEKHKEKIVLNYPKEFRVLKKIISSGEVEDEKKIDILNRLIIEKNYSIQDANEESINLSISYEDFVKKCSKIKISLESLNIPDLKKNEKGNLKKQLQDLAKLINSKLDDLE